MEVDFLKRMNDHTNIWYMLIYSVVVIGFTFLYTALIFNPKQISDNLKQNNGFIPGVKLAGQPTADYIGTIMDRITLPIRGFFIGIGGSLSRYCCSFWSNAAILYFLRRNFAVDYGRCCVGYITANRNSVVDASI